ncbi:MAG: 6-phosphogluconolactonase [Phycisphaeraceae bacterium]
MTTPAIQLPGRVFISADCDALFDDLASSLMSSAIKAVHDRGVFHLALSGGSTPEPFYMQLMIDPRWRIVPWERTHLWIVDERRVPESDPKSNFRMIRETLADHAPIPRRQVHPMAALADDAADLYQQELREVIAAPDQEGTLRPDPSFTPRLDFVLLGMGDDAHTASLFPGSDAVHEKVELVVVNEGRNVTPPPRVTMTFPLLNAARQVAILVTDQKKAATLRKVSDHLREAAADPVLYPITGIAPVEGGLAWYLDAAAAGVE